MKRTAAIHSFRARPSDSRRNKINMSSNLPMIYGRSVCSKVGEGCPLVITQLLIIETPVYVRLPRINLWVRAILRQRLTSKRTSRWKLRFPSFYTPPFLPRPYALPLCSSLDSFRSPLETIFRSRDKKRKNYLLRRNIFFFNSTVVVSFVQYKPDVNCRPRANYRNNTNN